MKLSISIIFALVGFISAETCKPGYWRASENEACNYACSDGCAESKCAEIGGKCDTAECVKGWESKNNNGKCDVPQCFGSAGCSEGGQCIAPNHCICGESGAQIVAKRVNQGEDNEGYDCVSLRKDGIMGAGIALVIMTVAISICGGIAEKNGKAK